MRRRVIGIATALLGAGALAVPVHTAFASGGSATATTTTVKIVNSSSTCSTFFCYKPQKVTVARGTKVVWKNMSSSSHTVTRCTVSACGVSGGTGMQAGPASPVIGPGGMYSFTFRKSGSYVYYCQIHGYATMHGTVVVK